MRYFAYFALSSGEPLSHIEPLRATSCLLLLTQGPNSTSPIVGLLLWSRVSRGRFNCFPFASLLLRFFCRFSVVVLPFLLPFCACFVRFATLLQPFCTLSRWCYFLSLFSLLFLSLPSFCLSFAYFPNARVRTMRTLRTIRTQVFAFSLIARVFQVRISFAMLAFISIFQGYNDFPRQEGMKMCSFFAPFVLLSVKVSS